MNNNASSSSRPLLFVANWKMNKDYHDTQEYTNLLRKTLAIAPNNLVICPSFVSLSVCAYILKESIIDLGAQACSAAPSGAYTGQIDARSLSQVSCTYCLVGHSEHQKLTHETDQESAQKTARLIENQIIPIICVSADSSTDSPEQIGTKLEKKLSIFAQEPTVAAYTGTLVIAYEPTWAIGSGITPKPAAIAPIIGGLRKSSDTLFGAASVKLLYGGGITPESAPDIIQIKDCDGLLLGSTSLDFQKLQNIVSLRKKAY